MVLCLKSSFFSLRLAKRELQLCSAGSVNAGSTNSFPTEGEGLQGLQTLLMELTVKARGVLQVILWPEVLQGPC